MSDAEQVQQALAELWDVVKCRCHEAYTGRGLHDPDCQCDSTDALQIVTHRIKALTEQLAAARDDAKEAEAYAEELEAKLAECEKYRDAYAECDRIGAQAVRDLEAKLAKAVEGLHTVVQHEASTFFGPDGEKNKRASWRGVMRKVRATLAKIKGESHE